jgi:hypothetical protein
MQWAPEHLMQTDQEVLEATTNGRTLYDQLIPGPGEEVGLSHVDYADSLGPVVD